RSKRDWSSDVCSSDLPGGFLLRGPCAVLGAAALPGALRACGAALWGVHRLQAPDAGVRPLIFVLRHQAAAVAEASAGHSPDGGRSEERRVGDNRGMRR